MLERQKLIDDIRRASAIFQSYIGPGGRLNLTDTSVSAEGFVGGLLNVLFKWGLTNANSHSSNYPCVDLIDHARGLAVQVTSEKGSAKLASTINCLARHSSGNDIRFLKVFLLVPKQTHYKVDVVCPGICFDWQTDVLDFDGAVKAASLIEDLSHLREIHDYIVDALPSVFPEYERQVLPLRKPVSDPAVAWLAFSSRATCLVGRDLDLDRLSAFLMEPRSFCWWVVTGAGGSGKSRLALELCLRATGWQAGFLSRTEIDFNWSRFKPSKNTLIVIDYVASRARWVSDLILTISHNSTSFRSSVRVLLLERSIEMWWTAFIREESQSESAEIVACQYSEPLVVAELNPGAILAIAKEVVRDRDGQWSQETALRYFLALFQLDPKCRPLFAMILAQEFETLESGDSLSRLLKRVLSRESGRRQLLISSEEYLRRLENLLLLATFVGNLLPKSNGFAFLNTCDVADILPNVNFLDEDLYADIAGSAPGGPYLPGLQPDILGERFALDRLSANGIHRAQAHRLLVTAWALQPKDVREFALRSVSDFAGDTGIERLFDLPTDTSDARVEWVTMVAYLIMIGGCDFKFIKQQFDRAISVADEFIHEPRLQEAAALADYHMGCHVMQFGKPIDDADARGAAKWFDNAIARIGIRTPIGIGATLNLGCVYEGEGMVDQAICAFTTVIQTANARDEVRACALNNRANIYMDRGDHENAIRDRTAVLALKATSSDRRFVALFRRSESYCALKDYEHALDDLTKILSNNSIGSNDKLLARLERASLLALQFNQLDDALDDIKKLLGRPERLPESIRNSLFAVVADTSENAEATRERWEELSILVQRSANRMRIAPLIIDQKA